MSEYRLEKLGQESGIFVSDEHTFGTDAFLLADFCSARRKDRVCDIGTGCGIIAMLIKLRYGSRIVTGIDIQPQAIEQFTRSIEYSHLENVNALLMDIKQPDPALFNSYELVVCNPPYKAAGAGIESTGDAARTARHETMCTLDDICLAAAKMLNYGGRFCMCNRPERLADAMTAMKSSGIEPKRLRLVHKNARSAPWLFLLEGRRGGKSFMRIEPPLLMSDGGISDELRFIYGMDAGTN